MDNRLATLLTRGESLTRTEYRVLAHLTEHPLLVGNITVRELAQATFVSTATIMRLCQKLGFSGFSEFIWHCKQLLTDTPHIAAQAQDLPHLPALFSQFIANYQQTFQWVTEEKRRQFATLLREKESFFLRRRVFLFVRGVPDEKAAGAGQNGLYLRAGRQPEYFSEQRRALSGVYRSVAQR